MYLFSPLHPSLWKVLAKYYLLCVCACNIYLNIFKLGTDLMAICPIWVLLFKALWVDSSELYHPKLLQIVLDGRVHCYAIPKEGLKKVEIIKFSNIFHHNPVPNLHLKFIWHFLPLHWVFTLYLILSGDDSNVLSLQSHCQKEKN